MKSHSNSLKIPEEVIRLNAVFQTATDGIITIDDKGVIGTINPAITSLFGYTEKELIGQNVKTLMPLPDKKKHDGYLASYQKTKENKIVGIGREVFAQHKDGTIFPIRLAVSEMILPKGTFFTGIIHDLSQQKKTEKAILELNKKLETLVERRTKELAKSVNQLLEVNRQLEYENIDRKNAEAALRQQEKDLVKALEKEKNLNQLKSRFVSMASHEFRTPLSAILTAAELVEIYNKEEQQSKRVKNINRIKNAVGTLTSILTDFLSLGKLEEGEIGIHPQHFVFGDFCKKALDECKGVLKTGQHIKSTNLSENITLFLDKNILKNIIFNLISNAAKYSEEDKVIECLTKISAKKLIIKIKDTGVGIPKEDEPYLFDRFFRAHNVENIQGTGLGLNITKKYVEILNGDISFKSQLGKGTTFVVELPVA